MNRAHIMGGVAGPVAALMFLGGLLAAGFLPPMSPTISQQDLVAHYTTHINGVRICAIALLFLLTGLMTQYTALADQLGMIDGPHSKSWARLQVMLGGISLVPVYGTSITWALASYRLDRSAEATQLLSDLGWFCFVMPVAPALVQMWSVGFAVLSDRAARPTFPRWYGYFSLWIGVLLMSGLLVPYFKHGPFAWNGLLAFWVAAVALGTWVNLTGFLMVGVARRGDASEREAVSQIKPRLAPRSPAA